MDQKKAKAFVELKRGKAENKQYIFNKSDGIIR